MTHVLGSWIDVHYFYWLQSTQFKDCLMSKYRSIESIMYIVLLLLECIQPHNALNARFERKGNKADQDYAELAII